MKTVHPLVTLRRSAGLAPVRGLSAVELRAKNPALASKWSRFIADNKTAIAAGLVRSV